MLNGLRFAVRGMMYYRKALMLQTYLERTTSEGQHYQICSLLLYPAWGQLPYHVLAISDLEAAVSSTDATNTRGFELSPEARAQADLKFTYVVTCQIYGKQKEEQKPEAADIALLMQR